MRARVDAGSLGAQRLGILLPDLSGGGAEKMAVVLANSAASRGIATTLLLLRNGGPLRAEVDRDVEIVQLDCASTRSCVFPLWRWMRNSRPHALMVTPSHLGWAACVAAIGLASPPGIFVREASTLSVDLSMMSTPARFARLFAERGLARRASRIALCDYCADDLAGTLRLRRSDINVIANPVVSPRLRDARAAVRRTKHGRPALLAAGRLVHQKGFDILVRAFDILRRSRDAQLTIAGDGPELARLQRFAEATPWAADIEFVGYQDLDQSMCRASVFVLPSRWEGLPGVLIEALALGTPVVATDCPGGTREVLENGRWGELVPVDDAEALAEAIDRALDSPYPPPGDTWRRRYSVDTAVSRYLTVMGFVRD